MDFDVPRSTGSFGWRITMQVTISCFRSSRGRATRIRNEILLVSTHHGKRAELKAEMRYKENFVLKEEEDDVEDDLRFAESEAGALDLKLGKRFRWYKGDTKS